MPRTIAEERILVQSAQEKANAILDQERTIRLNASSAGAVFTLMKNPPEPNEYLKNAMKRRMETLRAA